MLLGVHNRSMDSIISTKEGIELARTVRAKIESEAWSIEAIGAIRSYTEYV